MVESKTFTYKNFNEWDRVYVTVTPMFRRRKLVCQFRVRGVNFNPHMIKDFKTFYRPHNIFTPLMKRDLHQAVIERSQC
jgi:hypothetical protein